ncbi:uncharacterized protein PHALS_14545 [Plasmopara halstedii]|uniref:Uncharacterized protein n=1 Tax=Plasmopara halstedii TaxID=4781 RepID=A0A0P1AL16_PLAHL|nr:uncharacterized protein PHALS_14545 [Plasmopara halstedii]CEG41618.1 hypothetical protein PHALS_14545 [Plasmopara halstedii]|eukprot:XP_024577987.1 hypothetical protein PHALS_14545 [Plasmopara halstedii]
MGILIDSSKKVVFFPTKQSHELLSSLFHLFLSFYSLQLTFRTLYFTCRLHRYFLPFFRYIVPKSDKTITFCKDCMVLSKTYTGSNMVLGTSLTNDDISSQNALTSKLLHAQTL